jgi:hypothetical protein
MSTTLKLGLDRRPSELFQGMDKNSAFVCDILQRDLGFPPLVRATPDAIAWTAKKPGVAATVKYASEDLIMAFERLTGVAGRLHVSLHLDKHTPREFALHTAFSTAHGILARTDWDAAFCLEWDHPILRRIQGETFLEEISSLFPRGDTDALLRELDPSGHAHRGFR